MHLLKSRLPCTGAGMASRHKSLACKVSLSPACGPKQLSGVLLQATCTPRRQKCLPHASQKHEYLPAAARDAPAGQMSEDLRPARTVEGVCRLHVSSAKQPRRSTAASTPCSSSCRSSVSSSQCCEHKQTAPRKRAPCIPSPAAFAAQYAQAAAGLRTLWKRRSNASQWRAVPHSSGSI